MSLKAENIAEYLRENPEFFNEHAGILAEIRLQHPHGGRTVSLSERQLLVMRERIKELEKKLHDLMLLAHENDGLQHKVHLYALALLGTHDLATLKEVATRSLREIFAVPHAVMHLWQEVPPTAEVISFADQHASPVCAHQPVHETGTWFGEHAELLKSYAFLSLQDGEKSIGMLVMASEDAQRFYPEMGTMFLQRIADMVSRALLAQMQHA